MGQFDLSIDSKGRLFLPSSFRSAFADGGVLARRQGKLALYTHEANDAVVERLCGKLHGGEIDRNTFDLIMGRSNVVQLDAQGRISIPKNVREEYELEGPVLMLGTHDCLSIYKVDRSPLNDAAAIEAANAVMNEFGL